MLHIKILRLLLIGTFTLTIGSCEDNEDTESVITSFEKFPVTLATPAVTAPESEQETYTFEFLLDNRQITDVLINVGIGGSSTAEEHVDFELSVHEVELQAFEGQDGFSIDVTILEDFEVEGEDEKIYLTFTTATPSGIDPTEILVATITDSGLSPQPGETADFVLSWAFTDPKAAELDSCDLDLDLTVQPAGAPSYGADIMGNAAATLSCVEEGSAALEDMADGVVYDVWVWIYGDIDYGDLSALTVSLGHSRENTSFSGTLEIEEVFDSRQNEEAIKVATIERNGDVVTLKDAGGNVVSEGRINGYQVIRGVKKGI